MATALIVGSDPTGQHAYMRFLVQMISAGMFANLPARPFRLVVAHDPECPLLTGGTCDCQPEFRLEEVE